MSTNTKYLRYCSWTAVLLMGGVFISDSAASGDLRAAAVTVDITPEQPKMLGGYAPRQSVGVHNRIHHRALVLDDGKTQWVLVSSEFCIMSPATYEAAAARLQTELGIPRINFWWSLTHTHSAPEIGSPGIAAAFLGDRYQHSVDEEYTRFVIDALVDAVGDALEKRVPARFGVGWGTSNANINRRARDIDGTTSLGMNPDGPVDRKIAVLRVETQEGPLLALVANYPIHGTVLGGQSCLISGDAPGVVSTYLEKRFDAPVLFLNGAAGNIAPIYSVYPDPKRGHLGQFRVLLGDRIREAAERAKVEYSSASLEIQERDVRLPRRADLDWPGELADFSTSNDGSKMVKMPVRFLKINNDVGVWAAPIELFCEVAMEIRELSPFQSTLFFGYTNGWLGYLLTDDELAFGGYESRVTPFAAGADVRLRDDVVRHLLEMNSLP